MSLSSEARVAIKVITPLVAFEFIAAHPRRKRLQCRVSRANVDSLRKNKKELMRVRRVLWDG